MVKNLFLHIFQIASVTLFLYCRATISALEETDWFYDNLYMAITVRVKNREIINIRENSNIYQKQAHYRSMSVLLYDATV